MRYKDEGKLQQDVTELKTNPNQLEEIIEESKDEQPSFGSLRSMPNYAGFQTEHRLVEEKPDDSFNNEINDIRQAFNQVQNDLAVCHDILQQRKEIP